MGIFTTIKSWFTRKPTLPTVNTFSQLKQIYAGLMGLNLSIINRVNYPVLYKDMSDYKFTLDGVQYSVHMRELHNWGIKDCSDSVLNSVPNFPGIGVMSYEQTPAEPLSAGVPAQQFNISISNRNVSIDLMAGIDGSIKLNSNAQPSTVKAILSALQDTVVDALQVCAKHANTKRVPIIVDEYGKKITDEQAISAGKELESLYIS